ncbi:MAG: DoxX family protein [Deltaproteobacteria bacterium]
MTALFALFMIAASVAPKLLGLEVAKTSFTDIGWSHDHILMIGLMELIFTLLVVIPRTSVLGGILMTALLGGAIASQLRVDAPLFSHVLFGIYLGVLMWLAIWLRSPGFRAAIF